VIDAATNHASLPFHLARIAGDGFAVIRSRPKVAADPYMVGRLPIIRAGSGKTQLRIVS
jgi:hypothetical protein